MRDRYQLARQCHLRTLQAASAGDIERPTFETRQPRCSAQHDVGCLVKGSAHHRVADPTADNVYFSPDWYFLGVNPKCEPTAFDRPNRPGFEWDAT